MQLGVRLLIDENNKLNNIPSHVTTAQQTFNKKHSRTVTLSEKHNRQTDRQMQPTMLISTERSAPTNTYKHTY